MNKIQFNDFECEVVSFYKNTYFNHDTISGNINCEIVTNDFDGLQNLGSEKITTITIRHDEDVIYSVTNFSGQLASTTESLTDDHITININLTIG